MEENILCDLSFWAVYQAKKLHDGKWHGILKCIVYKAGYSINQYNMKWALYYRAHPLTDSEKTKHMAVSKLKTCEFFLNVWFMV